MLFMLWIKNKFSECLAPLHKHEGSQLPENFLTTVLPRPADTGVFGAVTHKPFLWPPNFVVLRKICFKHMIYKQKSFPLKMYFFPPNVKLMATGLVLPKLCLQLRYFFLKAIRAGDVA